MNQAQLRALAQEALALEHLVLPPYLCAMWSILPGALPEVRRLVRSVAMEEMLHMAVAANLVLALGGEPSLTEPAFITTYPVRSAGYKLRVGPLSPTLVQSFCALEAPDHVVEAEDARPLRPEAVYLPLRAGLIAAVTERGEARVFVGDPRRQAPTSLWWGGRGTLRPITDLTSALAAIDEVLGQTSGGRGDGSGQGESGEADEALSAPSHYHRFKALLEPSSADAPVDWSQVYAWDGQPAPDPHVRDEQRRFYAAWSGILVELERVLRGEHARVLGLLPRMFALGPAAVRLMRLPGATPGTGAGPCFGQWDRPIATRSDTAAGDVHPPLPWSPSRLVHAAHGGAGSARA